MLFQIPGLNFSVNKLALMVFAVAGLGMGSRVAHAADPPAPENYKRNCAICHGPDGAGTALGKKLHAADLRSEPVHKETPDATARVITQGRENMPAFGSKLSKDEIQALVDYVRQFHGEGAGTTK